MIYTCSKQGKIDRLWGVFLGHLIQMQNAGIKVEYVRKGEVILNGKRYKPVYRENTMSYEPIGWRYEKQYIILTGHNIQPLIDYLKPFNKALGCPHGQMLEDMVAACFGVYSPENYEKAVRLVGSLGTMGFIPTHEADRIVSEMDKIDDSEE